MKNIPKIIYLNFGFCKAEVDEDADFNDMTEITWSIERINDADIKYELSKTKNQKEKQNDIH